MANKNYTVMELEAIKKLCKSVNLIANLPTNLIADTNVATNTTYSSYRIDAEMSALENDIQRYVDTALAGLNKLTKEVIDDKALVVKENVLYLYKDPSDINNDYMQMMLINGVAVELGSTTCDFSSVYSKDEIDDKFVLKIDLDVLTTSFNNLVTSVEKKIDKDKIVTVLDDTVTDEQVASAKVVFDGLKSINDFSVQVVKENLDLNDMTETGIYFFSQTYTPVNIPVGVNGWLLVMKGSSSDIVKQVWYRLGTANSNSYNTFERYKGGNTWSEWTKFLTEKEYYSALDYGNPVIPQDADLNDYLTPGVYTCMSSEIANTLVNCPHINSNFKLIVNRNRGNSNTFYGYQMIVGTIGGNPVTDVCIYYRGISMYDNVCVFSKWKIMSGSTVADVPKTTLTPVFPSGVVVASGGVVITYVVRNGWCNVNFVFHVTSATTFLWTDIATGLPKPANNANIVLMSEGGKATQPIAIKINSTGSVSSRVPSAISTTDWWTGNISYPVAE